MITGYLGRGAVYPTMRVAIGGSSGFVGSALTRALEEDGCEVVRLVRGSPSPGSEARSWDPSRGRLEAGALEGCDAVVSLSGENIAGGRWTRNRKRRILESRTKSVSLLSSVMGSMQDPPKTLVCASAVGYYGGDTGDAVLDETSPAGDDFLAEVCREWETAAQAARDAGLRVAHLRFGIVLHPSGGALGRMLLPFKLGLGGPMGHGRQWMSWLTLRESVHIVRFALEHRECDGAVNAVSPNPALNAEFARALGKAVHRPARLRMPAWLIRMALGEMGESLLLSGQRVRPKRLEEMGYSFLDPELDVALRGFWGE